MRLKDDNKPYKYIKSICNQHHRHDEFEVDESVMLPTKNLYVSGPSKLQQHFTSLLQVV